MSRPVIPSDFMTRNVLMATAAMLVTTYAGVSLAQPLPGQAPAPVAGAGPVCRGSDGFAADFGGRRTFLWRPDWLEAAKTHALDPSNDEALGALVTRADAALRHGPYTVVDKRQMPASGDRHDYMSMGPYWWADPSKPDGLPYVRRDGEMNPERLTNAFDVSDLQALSDDVRTLALAYYFTGEDRYAVKAAALVRVWFLDPATRMNPNLNHGQAVPGRVSGRAEGVIDAHRLVPIVEALGLLDPSGALSDAEKEGLRDWFGGLVQWMATSTIGREEAAAANNHGVYYDALISQFALYAGFDDVARAVIERTPARLAKQIEPDGRLPRELTRTRSLHYTTWTIGAAMDLAMLGQCVNVDLWNWKAADGRSLRAATDFVGAYAGREGDWPYPELDKSEIVGLYDILRRGGWAWRDPAMAAQAEVYDARMASDEITLRSPR